MAGSVLRMLDRIHSRRDWTNQELAELYRVAHALSAAGVALEVDRGITDEGDPWFVFCRPDGDVLVHLARFDGLYHLFSPALPAPLSGRSFTDLTRSFLEGRDVVRQRGKGADIILHPSARFGVLVLTIFFSAQFVASDAASAAQSGVDGEQGPTGAAERLDASAQAPAARPALKAAYANVTGALSTSGLHEAAGAQAAILTLIGSISAVAAILETTAADAAVVRTAEESTSGSVVEAPSDQRGAGEAHSPVRHAQEFNPLGADQIDARGSLSGESGGAVSNPVLLSAVREHAALEIDFETVSQAPAEVERSSPLDETRRLGPITAESSPGALESRDEVQSSGSNHAHEPQSQGEVEHVARDEGRDQTGSEGEPDHPAARTSSTASVRTSSLSDRSDPDVGLHVANRDASLRPKTSSDSEVPEAPEVRVVDADPGAAEVLDQQPSPAPPPLDPLALILQAVASLSKGSVDYDDAVAFVSDASAGGLEHHRLGAFENRLLNAVQSPTQDFTDVEMGLIREFVGRATDPEIAIKDGHMVVFDDAVHHALDVHTWRLGENTTVSLVGLGPAELDQLH